MDFFFNLIGKVTTVDVALPLWHILLLVFISTLFMLMGRFRFVIITLYSFSFIWIFVKNEDAISKVLTSQPQFTFGFILSGAILIGLAIWSFFIEGD
ncbi:MAG: hypothetical protein JW928_03150 [Candidatus Aureabacteria bacterium]|nr:hypothetical protein [Candidatus Auribacterota bacterium]